MGKRVFIMVIVLLLLVVSLTWLGLRSQTPEPVYQGKRLSYWLDNYWVPATSANTFVITTSMGQMTAASVENSKTVEAIKAAGTNAIPILLRRLTEGDAHFVRELIWLAQKWHLMRPNHRYTDRREVAVSCLLALGERAKGGLPTIIKVYDADNSPFLRLNIPKIFQNVGPSASNAIPSLLRVASATNEQIYARLAAINTLEIIHAEPNVVVPMHIRNLRDGDPHIRENGIIRPGIVSK